MRHSVGGAGLQSTVTQQGELNKVDVAEAAGLGGLKQVEHV